MEGNSLYVASLDFYLMWLTYLKAFPSMVLFTSAFAHELGAQFSQLCLFVSGHFSVQLYVTLDIWVRLKRKRKKKKINKQINYLTYVLAVVRV